MPLRRRFTVWHCGVSISSPKPFGRVLPSEQQNPQALHLLLNFSRNHAGCAPLPAHVLPDLARYFTATFRVRAIALHLLWEMPTTRIVFQANVPWNDNTLYFDFGSTAANRITTPFASYLNKWTHVVLTNDGIRMAGVAWRRDDRADRRSSRATARNALHDWNSVPVLLKE